MYEKFCGLRELPFELTPNPRFLYLTQGHREALSMLQYALAAAKGVTVLVGEAGTGKTTLLKAAFETDLCRHVRSLHLANPTLSRSEFLETLAHGFGLTSQAAASKAVLLTELERMLRERRSRGEVTALIVDEAQCMSVALLEEIRLLANIESATQKLLPLVLVGQPEFGMHLEQPELRQLKQRISLRCEITPFSLQETAAYVATRIAAAGGSASRLFTREAMVMIHEHSGGIPRTISVICDNALLAALAVRRQPVDEDIVLEVVGDFRLRSNTTTRRGAPIEQRPAARVVEARPKPEAPPTRDTATDEGRSFSGGASPKRWFAMFGGGRN